LHLNLLNLKFKICKRPQMKKYQNKLVKLQKLFKFAVDSYFI
jgi:hypothetical protein